MSEITLTSYRTTPSQGKGEIRFYEWLAGLIDGHGAFKVSEKGQVRVEIRMSKINEHILISIQKKLGGVIPSIPGSKSSKYVLTDRQGVTLLLDRVNGNIRHSVRVPQYKLACSILCIPYVPAIALTSENAWFSGMFDAAGTISGSFHSHSPVITLAVINKHEVDVLPFSVFSGGNVYYDKSGTGS